MRSPARPRTRSERRHAAGRLTPAAAGPGRRAAPQRRSYPVPPMEETHARTEVIIGNWLKARGNRDQVGCVFFWGGTHRPSPRRAGPAGGGGGRCRA